MGINIAYDEEKEKYLIAHGRAIISEKEFDTSEAAEDYLTSMIDYDLIVVLIHHITDRMLNAKMNEK